MNHVLFQIVYLRMNTVCLFIDSFCPVSGFLPHLDTVRLSRVAPHPQFLVESSSGQLNNLLCVHLIHILVTDIATEEFAHMEIVCAIVHQLTRNLTPEQLEKSGFDKYYVDHTLALWPQAASGTPWSATTFQSKGDPITDLHEDMAAEQKARTTYDNILRLIKDPEVCDPIRFLREREIVHYQRFGESLRIVQDKLDSKNFYAFNPEFDHKSCCK